jgi:hypothetical protein
MFKFNKSKVFSYCDKYILLTKDTERCPMAAAAAAAAAERVELPGHSAPSVSASPKSE